MLLAIEQTYSSYSFNSLHSFHLSAQLFLHVVCNSEIPQGFYNPIKTISLYIGQQYNDRIAVTVPFSENSKTIT